MANEPVRDSRFIAGVAPEKNSDGMYVPLRIVVDDSYDPPRLLAHVLGNLNNALPGVYTEAYAYDASSNLEYLGWAAPGSSKAAAVWAIVKYTYTGATITDKQWAGGAATFDQIWDNRTGLTYS